MSTIPDSINSVSYPKSDRNDDLEELSLTAFKNILPVEKFLFRDERIKDKGVDGSLELKTDCGYTNLRSQVQLKSTDSEDVNKDGTISVEVRVRSLNYILNGLSPIYVLYVAPRDELRYLWAREEANRLNRTNPKWRQQKTITLRFKELLTAEAIDHIYEHIRREAQLHRRIQDVLARATGHEYVKISINPTTLENTDPDEVNLLLLTSGATIVSSGCALQVTRLLDLLNPSDARAPRIQLIRAYAEYALGRYQLALGHLAEASLVRSELCAEDQQSLACIRDACEFNTGQISLQEMSERIEMRIKQGIGGISFMDRLNQARYALFVEADISRRDSLLESLGSIVNEVLALPNLAGSSKLSARLILFEAEGNQSLFKSYADLMESNFIRTLGGPVSPAEVLKKQFEQCEIWEREFDPILQEAIDSNNPLITADALLVKASVRVGYFTNSQVIGLTLGAIVQLAQSFIHETMQIVEEAMNIHRQAGQLEGELRARLLLANLFVFTGQESAACELAKGVLPQAQIMNYAVHVAHAKQIISGKTFLSETVAGVKADLEQDADDSIASDTDENIRLFASECLRLRKLPIEGLPFLELEAFALRDIARERLDWCRHMDLDQRTSNAADNSKSPGNAFQNTCVCVRFDYRLTLDNLDHKMVISAFKEKYCAECSARSPKR
jgi:hypothetical protein